MIRLADNFEPPARVGEDEVMAFVNNAAEENSTPYDEAEMSRARRAHPSALVSRPRPHLSLVP